MTGLIVVTGAGGFVGRAMCAHLDRIGRPYRAVVRQSGGTGLQRTGEIAIGDLSSASQESLAAVVEGAAAIVHLAGRAHVMHETSSNAFALYHAGNAISTERLATAAVRAGVHRFVLASTIKVYGEATSPGQPFRVGDSLAPQDGYARSKVEAEQKLASACAGTAMTPIIVRMPLVYGPGVKGNFLTLIDAVARRALLPLGAIRNRRDLIYVGNLAHALTAAIDATGPLRRVWLVSDGETMSTPELARRLGEALGVGPRLLSVPVPLLTLGASLAGRAAMVERLAKSLEVDAAPTHAQVGPMPFSVDEGLAETARWWRARHAI